MTTHREAFPSKWLKAEDLGGKDLPVTVDHTSLEGVQAPGGALEQKVTLHFREGFKSLILNSTNFKAMVAITGQEDSDNWTGAQALLTTEQAAFGGKIYPAIRIKAMPAIKSPADVNAALEQAEIESPFQN
jgi:hypothetical protein